MHRWVVVLQMEYSSPSRARRSPEYGPARVLRRALAAGWLGVALLLPVGAVEAQDVDNGGAQTSKVGAGLAEQIANDGSAVVLVHLRPRRLSGSAVSREEGVAEFRQQIARVQDSVLEILEEDEDTRVRYQYEYVPGLAIEVDDYSLLETVAELAEVVLSFLEEALGEGELVFVDLLGRESGVHAA